MLTADRLISLINAFQWTRKTLLFIQTFGFGFLTSFLTSLTKSKRFYKIFSGERYSFKIKYRFQVLVPKRQILPCAVMRIIRSALTCLSVPFTTSSIPSKYQRTKTSIEQKHLLTTASELSTSIRKYCDVF